MIGIVVYTGVDALSGVSFCHPQFVGGTGSGDLLSELPHTCPL